MHVCTMKFWWSMKIDEYNVFTVSTNVSNDNKCPIIVYEIFDFIPNLTHYCVLLKKVITSVRLLGTFANWS